MLDRLTTLNNTTYTYDESGIRTSKTVNGVTTYYNTKDGVIFSQTDGTSTMYFQYDTSGTPLGFIYNNIQYFYLTNQMGDVIAITDVNGTIAGNYEYDDWGAITLSDSDIANINPIRYRGYYYDNETSYYYLQSRYYNADICRFINADDYNYIDKDAKTGINIFAYCGNEPVNYLDKSGCEKWSVGKSSYSSAITIEIKLYAGKALSTKAYFTYKAYSTKFITFDNSKNYAKQVALSSYFDEMADAIYTMVKSIHSSSLKGRTKKGIAAELAIHYYLYKMNYKTSHTKITDIGGTNIDYNAKDFESIAKIPNTFSNVLKGVKSTINKYKSKV